MLKFHTILYVITLPILLIFILCGCGNSHRTVGKVESSTPQLYSFPTTIVNGNISLPSGISVQNTGLSILNSQGSSVIATDGTFKLLSSTVGRQFAQVTDSEGNMILAGWIDANHLSLNIHTTAMVLLYFSSGCYMQSSEIYDQIIDKIDVYPGLAPLEAAITTSLMDNPHALSENDPRIATALKTAIDGLKTAIPLSRNTSIRSNKSRAILIQPAGARSGLTIDTTGGMNNIRIINEYRRRTHVFLERVSFLPAGGGTAVDAALKMENVRQEKLGGFSR